MTAVKPAAGSRQQCRRFVAGAARPGDHGSGAGPFGAGRLAQGHDQLHAKPACQVLRPARECGPRRSEGVEVGIASAARQPQHRRLQRACASSSRCEPSTCAVRPVLDVAPGTHHHRPDARGLECIAASQPAAAARPTDARWMMRRITTECPHHANHARHRRRCPRRRQSPRRPGAHKTIGEVISTLARQGLARNSRAPGTLRNGILLLPSRRGATAVTLELVNRFRDDSP